LTATAPGLTFLSWTRTGLAAAVRAPGGGSPLDAALPRNATLPVTLDLGAAGTGSYTTTVAGPGDAAALDTRQVIRTDPLDGATGVFPNYFPLIEFDSPDLPWLLTPNAPARATPADADARRGLRPWLVLVVVEDRPLVPPTATRPLALVEAGTDELPDLAEAWLWAHTQVVTTGANDEMLEQLLADAGSAPRTLSRLIAPCRLHPGTAYVACVVPAFEAGRRAGLGMEPDGAAHVVDAAWSTAGPARRIVLPVYHSWRFATGPIGDEEYLARLIQAAQQGGVGVRPLDISSAGTGIPAPAAGEAPWVLDYEGVVLGAKVQPGTWTAPRAADVRTALAARLAPHATVLSPPTYGSLQSGYAGNLTAAAAPKWLSDLNLDPRYRVVAAMGTSVVQQHAEALMASAWQQTAEMREANRLLRQAQLARAVGEVINRRRVSGDAAERALSGDRLLQLAAPVATQLAGGPARAGEAAGPTVAAMLAPSSAVTAALSVPFRRIARPGGPLKRRVTQGPVPAPVSRLAAAPDAAARLTPAPPFTDVGGMRTLQDAGGIPMRDVAPELVATPVFPWEAAQAIVAPGAGGSVVAPGLGHASFDVVAPAHPIPYGWLADIVLTTLDRPELQWQHAPWSAALGRSLDFDGVPQRPWEEVRDPAATSVGFSNWGSAYASTYVDVPGRTGLLDVTVQGQSVHGFNWYTSLVGWRPGRLFESNAQRVQVPAGVTWAYAVKGLAIAAGDLRGTGEVDAIVLWSNADRGWGSPPSQPDIQDDMTYYSIGYDLDANGVFQGGWSGGHSYGAGVGPYSAAIAGPNLYLLRGTSLEVNPMRPDGSIAGRVTVDLLPYLPDDTRSGAIAAADFGGGTNSDLLVFYCAGSGQALRLGYRIAYDVRGDGTIGGWGPHQPAPMSVAGTEIGVLVGATTAAAAASREQLTAAFRATAVATQTRQERVLPAAPQAPPPEVPAAQATDAVRTGLDPGKTVPAATLNRLSLATPIAAAGLTDVLQPLAITPRFPYPTFELLREAFPDRVLPGAGDFPDNAAAALRVNRAAIETYLVGLNAEMSRELLWRGFPVHHGTFFREFWRADTPDIADIAGWGDTALGTHAPAGPAPSLLLVVRAELLRRIPDVLVYAAPAKAGGAGRSVDVDKRKEPLFGGTLPDGLIYYAFDLTPEAAVGTGPADGWYFVFQQHPTAPRFGLDEPAAGSAYGTAPATWANVDWADVVADKAAYDRLGYLTAGATSPLAATSLPDSAAPGAHAHRWGFSAAHMAHITLQRPVQVAIAASRLLDLGGPA